MTIPKQDLIYWYRHFKHLLSGWTSQEQIQFHRYAISQLQDPNKERGTK